MIPFSSEKQNNHCNRRESPGQSRESPGQSRESPGFPSLFLSFHFQKHPPRSLNICGFTFYQSFSSARKRFVPRNIGMISKLIIW